MRGASHIEVFEYLFLAKLNALISSYVLLVPSQWQPTLTAMPGSKLLRSDAAHACTLASLATARVRATRSHKRRGSSLAIKGTTIEQVQSRI